MFRESDLTAGAQCIERHLLQIDILVVVTVQAVNDVDLGHNVVPDVLQMMVVTALLFVLLFVILLVAVAHCFGAGENLLNDPHHELQRLLLAQNDLHLGALQTQLEDVVQRPPAGCVQAGRLGIPDAHLDQKSISLIALRDLAQAAAALDLLWAGDHPHDVALG